MASTNAAFGFVPTAYAVLFAWLRWEAPLVVVVELAEVHEPLFVVVVVVPNAARLPRC